MSLTERERRCLDDLAREISHDDPDLAHRLTRGGWLPRRTRMRLSVLAFLGGRRWWQWIAAAAMVTGAVLVLASMDDSRSAVAVTGAAVLVPVSIALCVTRLAVHRRRRRAAG